MSFSGKHQGVVYILVSIKLHIGNDMDSGHYVCDLLDYNIGTWCICDDDTITQYPEYPINLYDDLPIDDKQKQKGKITCMNGSDMILSMVYSIFKKYILSLITYSLITGTSVSK